MTNAAPTGPESAPAKRPDLEIKDPRLIFSAVWRDLEAEIGRDNLRFPKELILLGGAPGAGKGTQTEFVLRTRGLDCPSIVVSSLLNTPAMRKIKDSGGLVGDREVMGLVFRELLKPEYRDGAVLDGFPRTQMQVESGLVNLGPGMSVTVEIKTGSRRIISYLLSPLVRYKQESLRER